MNESAAEEVKLRPKLTGLIDVLPGAQIISALPSQLMVELVFSYANKDGKRQAWRYVAAK